MLTVMRTGTKVIAGVAAATVVGVAAFVVPAVASSPAPTSAPTHTAAAEATADDSDFSDGYVDLGHGIRIPEGGPEGCEAPSWIYIGSDDDGPMHAEILGAALVDRGSREFATGTVERNAQGQIATYTVAAGDTEAAIGERLCIVNGTALGPLNHYAGGDAIQPGDVLSLIPDPNDEWPVPGPTH